MNFLDTIGNFLDGKKTIVFILLLLVFGFMDMKDYLPPMLENNKDEIYITLLAGAGISLRMGLNSANKKLEKDLIDKLK